MHIRQIFYGAFSAGLILAGCMLSAQAAEVPLQESVPYSTMLFRNAAVTTSFQPETTGVYRIYTTGDCDTVCSLSTGDVVLDNDDSEGDVNCSVIFLGMADRTYQCTFGLSSYAESDGMADLIVEPMSFLSLTAGQTVYSESHGVIGEDVSYQEQAYVFTPDVTGEYTFMLRITSTNCNELVQLYDEDMNCLEVVDHYYENDERTGSNTFSYSLTEGKTYLVLATEWIYSTGNVVLSATVTQNTTVPSESPSAEEPDTVDSTTPPDVSEAPPSADQADELSPITSTPSDPTTPAEDTPTVTPVWENPFVDVAEGKWYFEAVRFCCIHNLFQGTSQTTFEPELYMTRAMLVQVLHALSGVESYPVSYVFQDVSPTAWYAQPVSWAYANGIAQGIGNGQFDPNGWVTREQMVRILRSYYWNYLGKTPSNIMALDFPDQDSVSSWAEDAVCWAVGNGLISGVLHPDGTIWLEPKGYATRAQVAAIMQRFDDLVY